MSINKLISFHPRTYLHAFNVDFLEGSVSGTATRRQTCRRRIQQRRHRRTRQIHQRSCIDRRHIRDGRTVEVEVEDWAVADLARVVQEVLQTVSNLNIKVI